jgi:DNA-binding MarR family transcriptional regulator
MSERRERAPSLAPGAGPAGKALRRLVDLVSHRSGQALAEMGEAGVTLPQVLLMSHIQRRGKASLSVLAQAMHVSLPAMSQMIERLVQQGLLDRGEDSTDRRRKSVAITATASSFLRKLEATRSREYELGLGSISRERLGQLATVLESVVAELESTGSGGRRAPQLHEKARVRR